jgi:hypothetical protein
LIIIKQPIHPVLFPFLLSIYLTTKRAAPAPSAPAPAPSAPAPTAAPDPVPTTAPVPVPTMPPPAAAPPPPKKKAAEKRKAYNANSSASKRKKDVDLEKLMAIMSLQCDHERASMISGSLTGLTLLRNM